MCSIFKKEYASLIDINIPVGRTSLLVTHTGQIIWTFKVHFHYASQVTSAMVLQSKM